MTRLLVVLVTALFPAVALSGDIVRIRIEGPTAIGVFPPATAQEGADDDGGAREGTSHVAFALEDLVKCLAPAQLATRFERTRRLVVENGSASRTVRFTAARGKSVGIVLAAPGKPPLVIYATAGPSSLQWLALDAAATYFNAPNCKQGRIP